MGGHNGWLDVYGMMSLNKLRFFGPGLREKPCSSTRPTTTWSCPPTCTAGTRSTGRCTSAPGSCCPGHLLASKGDRMAMHSSVETRYAFLDEDVIAFMAGLHPRWKLRGLLKDKFVERKVAERWLPKEVAWRRKHMFRAPMDTFAVRDAADGPAAGGGRPGSTRCCRRSRCARPGTSTPAAVAAARQRLAGMRGGLGRTGLEMGLTAVTATQLWHHLYIERRIWRPAERKLLPSPAA